MKIQNLERLKRKIAAIPKAARNDIFDALKTSGQEINSLQRQFVPREEGDLAGSIDMLPNEARLQVVLVAGGAATTRPVRDGADASYDYAFAQEFGTQKMPANPFFFPGFRLGKKKAKSRIAPAVTKAAKRVAAGGR